MNRESETGRARVGPWEFAWHPAWWLALICLAVAVLLFMFVEPAECYDCAPGRVNYDRAARVFTAVALAAYFWAYGRWRRLRHPASVTSEAEGALVALLGVILALALWPLSPPEWRCGPPVAAFTPWYGDLPLPCQDSLDQRQTQLVLLGLLAIPLAAGAARAPGRR
ncbi:hypothetical protein AAH991_04125 [Microbispora sp. ZYX-F-249]|uniref:Uncharacterized protein n=1 Tax=Microbispora maris TaxID=3144104 RepID=A0ABV0AG06_9ACTN